MGILLGKWTKNIRKFNTDGAVSHKRCSSCEEFKSIDLFDKNCQSHIDGRMNMCKDCRRDYCKKKRQENPELARSRGKRYREKIRGRFVVKDDSNYKFCRVCNINRQLKYFRRSKDTKDGAEGTCKFCKSRLENPGGKKCSVCGVAHFIFGTRKCENCTNKSSRKEP